MLKHGNFGITMVMQEQKEKQADGRHERIEALEKMLTDVRLREQKLSQSESRLRLLVERSPNGIVILTREGKFAYANEAAVQHLGYDRQEFFDLAIPDIEVGESIERFRKRYEDALAGKGLRYDTIHRKKDGSLMDVEVLVIVIRHADETIVYNIWRDMTERKQAEKKRVHHTRELAFVSKTAMEFVEFSPEQDIYRFIGRKLEELAGEDTHVGVAEYHEAANSLTPRYGTDTGNMLGRVAGVLDKNPLEMKVTGINDEAKKDLARGVLVKVPGGFYDLFFKQVPEEACRALEELFGMGEIYSMGLRRGEKLLGNVVIITKAGKSLENRGLIETFVNQASVAVERNIADQERVKAVAAVVDAMSDGLLLYEMKGKVIHINAALESLTGYSRKEVVGKEIMELLVNFMGGEVPSVSITFTFTVKDGSAIPVAASGSYIRNAEGRPTHAVILFKDITALKEAEKDLRESEETLRALYNGIPIPTYTFQRSGEKFLLIDYNDAAGDMMKGEIEKYVGAASDEMFEDLPEIQEDMDRCFTEKGTVKRERTIQTKRLSEKRHFSINYAYVDTDLILVHAEDITDRKRAEQDLRASREQLRNLSAHTIAVRETERTNIAREIHDELGQNMTALKMDLAWMAKKLPGKHKTLISKTKAMARLVNATIKTVRKISTELRPGLLDDLGLAAAIEWQAGEFQKRTGIKCDLVIKPEEIEIDRDRSTAVFRIFQETLTNVARHASAKKVTASLKKRAGKVFLKVGDNGKGITRKQATDSKSFGLIGMRERAHFWGGKVTIKGVQGKGTTVTVSIPIEGKEGKDGKGESQ